MKAGLFRAADFDYAGIDKSLARIVRNYPEVAAPRLAEIKTLWASVNAGDAPPHPIERIGQLAHDFKGEGGSFGFPLVTAIAETLCLLCERGDLGRANLAAAIDAHIAAIQVVLKQDIRGDGGPTGKAVVEALRIAIGKIGR